MLSVPDSVVVGDAPAPRQPWYERAVWIAGVALLVGYAGVRIWADEARASAIAQISVPAADKSLWSKERVRAYAESVAAGGTPEAVLRIPSVNLAVPVYSTTSELNLNRGAGHIEGTAKIEAAGNVGIAGHRDGFFRALKDLTLDGSIYLEHGGLTRRYRIVEMSIVSPEEVGVLAPTAKSSVTLVTCYPFYFVGSAPQRFIVRAELDPRAH